MKTLYINIVFPFHSRSSHEKKVVGLQLPATHIFSFMTKGNFQNQKIKSKKIEGEKMSRYTRSKKLEPGKFMPPLYHKLPGEDYDVRKSQAVKWLIKNPSILEYIWDKFKQSNDVVYNPETGKWQGVDYDKE